MEKLVISSEAWKFQERERERNMNERLGNFNIHFLDDFPIYSTTQELPAVSERENNRDFKKCWC